MERAQKKASEFQERLVNKARTRGPQGADEGSFFAALFRLAAETIEEDVDEFCDRAEAAFEEIEAFGQELGLRSRKYLNTDILANCGR